MHKLAIGAMICFFDYALCTHDLLVTDNGRTRRLHARQVSMQKYLRAAKMLRKTARVSRIFAQHAREHPDNNILLAIE